MRFCWWVGIFLLLGHFSLAQPQLPPKCFFSSKSYHQEPVRKDSVFCLGDTVYAHFCLSETGIDPTTVRYNWFNNSPAGFGSDSFFIYQNPGTYTIYQRYTQNINCQFTVCSVVSGPITIRVIDLGLPKFTVIPCTGNRAFLRITDTIFDKYSIDWGDGTPVTNNVQPQGSAEHNYATQGSFQITVTGKDNSAGCERSVALPVTILPTPVLSLDSVLLLSSGPQGRVRLFFPVTQGFSYTVKQRPASGGAFLPVFTTKPTVSNPQFTYTVDSLNTAQPWCFQIALNDSCTSTAELLSDPICTVPLTVVAANGQNLLTWPDYPPSISPQPITYQIRKNKSTLISVPGTEENYDDTLVTCGSVYCYQLTAQFSNGRLSRSTTDCDTAILVAQLPVAYAEASFTPANVLELKIFPDASAGAARTVVKRSQNPGPFQPIGSAPGILFQDDSLQLPTTYCYQVAYQDNCQNESPFSSTVCPIILTGTISNLPNGQQGVSLTWTDYTGFRAGVNDYQVEVLREDNSVLEAFPAGPGSPHQYKASVLPEDLQIVRYRIKGISGDTTVEGPVYSNLVTFVQNFQLAIPNAFSPNNDNLNDLFEVKGLFARQFSLTVVDRNGMVVFRSTNPQTGWDGKINGTPAPIDAYVYELVAKDETGTEIRRTGTVTLVR